MNDPVCPGLRSAEPRYRDPAGIDREALRAMVENAVRDHPEWSDEQVADGLKVIYPGHDPAELDRLLRGEVFAARLPRGQ